jgi:uncharacterized membrane protein
LYWKFALFLLDELCVMNKFFRAPIRTFVAGLLTVLPVVLTVAVIVWVTSLVDQFVGPQSAMGKLLVSIGLTVVETRIAAYVIGIGVVLCAVYVLGVFVEAGVQRRLQVFIDSSLRRIPLVGSVYDLAHRFVGMFERKEPTDLKTMSPVWCFFGGEGGAAVLALLPTPETILLGGPLVSCGLGAHGTGAVWGRVVFCPRRVDQAGAIWNRGLGVMPKALG